MGGKITERWDSEERRPPDKQNSRKESVFHFCYTHTHGCALLLSPFIGLLEQCFNNYYKQSCFIKSGYVRTFSHCPTELLSETCTFIS